MTARKGGEQADHSLWVPESWVNYHMPAFPLPGRGAATSQKFGLSIIPFSSFLPSFLPLFSLPSSIRLYLFSVAVLPPLPPSLSPFISLPFLFSLSRESHPLKPATGSGPGRAMTPNSFLHSEVKIGLLLVVRAVLKRFTDDELQL